MNWNFSELKVAMRGAFAAGSDFPMPWLPNSGETLSMRRGSLEGYIFQNPTHVVVAFQGTEKEVGDIATDLDYRRVKMPGVPGRWHRGFLEGAGAFSVEVILWLRKNLGNRRLIVTGFSLGAALAQCMSMFLYRAGWEPVTYSFGGPRVANRKAGRWLTTNTEHYRIITYDDPVPHLPPFFFGFKHLGELGVWGDWDYLVIGPGAWRTAWRPWHKRNSRHGHSNMRYLLLALRL
jgi:hypothetical protein